MLRAAGERLVVAEEEEKVVALNRRTNSWSKQSSRLQHVSTGEIICHKRMSRAAEERLLMAGKEEEEDVVALKRRKNSWE